MLTLPTAMHERAIHSDASGEFDGERSVPLHGTGFVPHALGRYTLRHPLAEGGMAAVYLAQHRGAGSFHKWLAIKLVHSHLTTDTRFVDMFLDEARLAARIEHPNVCAVYDFGESDGSYFLAMEYLHGESLASVVSLAWQRDGLPHEVTAALIADAARGLHAAHELRTPDGTPAEVVHRDVSPQNIFVRYDGIAKVVDFGVARSRERLAERTTTGEVKGKLAYMAPEQLKQQPVDRRADVFALGVVLWEATLGRRLFKRDSEGATVYAVVHDELPPPSQFDPAYPPALERIVMHALERAVDSRYATADAMARDLEAFVASTAKPAGPSRLTAIMRELFAERIDAREQLLLELERSPAPRDGAQPFRETETSRTQRVETREPAAAVAPSGPRRSRSRVVAAVALASIVATGTFVAMQRWFRTPVPASRDATTAPPPASRSATPAADRAPAAGEPNGPSTAAVPAVAATAVPMRGPTETAHAPTHLVRPDRSHPHAGAPAAASPRTAPRAGATAVGLSRSYDAFRNRAATAP